jgi:hypothetical protein
MCLKKECVYVELIEYPNGIQIITHYDKDNNILMVEKYIGDVLLKSIDYTERNKSCALIALSGLNPSGKSSLCVGR